LVGASDCRGDTVIVMAWSAWSGSAAVSNNAANHVRRLNISGGSHQLVDDEDMLHVSTSGNRRTVRVSVVLGGAVS